MMSGMTEQEARQAFEDITTCRICGRPMKHTRLYGYICTPYCEEKKHEEDLQLAREYYRKYKKG